MVFAGIMAFVAVGAILWALFNVRSARLATEKADQRSTILAAAVDRIPAVVAITNTNAELEYVNPMFEKTTGYSADEAMGQNPRILKSELMDEQEYFEMWATLKKTGHWEGEFCNKAKDGTLIWESATIVAVSNKSGETTHYIKVAENITEKKRALSRLEESERRFRSIFEQAAVGIGLVDREGRWFEVNDYLCSMVGYHRDELKGRSFLEITHDEDAPEEDNWNEAFEKGLIKTASTDKRYCCKDGSDIWVKVTATAILGLGNRPQYYLCLIEDQTRHREIEEKAARRQSQLAHLSRVNTLQQMASELAHEIDQPLCAILTTAQACRRIMETASCTVPEVLVAMDDLVGQAQRAGAVVSNVRKFSRKQELQKKIFDLNKVVAEAVALVEPDLRSHGVVIELKLSGSVDLPVTGDPLLVQQVVVNLCSNACDALETDGVAEKVIVLTTEEDESMVKVSVADSGIPLKSEMVASIFEPFFTTRNDGLGIGLSLSRSIIDSHDGMLWVDPGESTGNTFSFTLPAHV
jgi:nitrogen fixation negative regulator NifL